LFSNPSQPSRLQHLHLFINDISHSFPSLECVFSNSRLCFSTFRRARKAAALVSPRKSLLCLFVKPDAETTAHAVPQGRRSRALCNRSSTALQRHHEYNRLAAHSVKAIELAGVQANFKEIICMNGYSCSAERLLQLTSALLAGLISIYLDLHA